MLCWALVEQARHEHMSNEYYKNRCIVAVFAEAPMLGLRGKHETTTVGSPTELANWSQVGSQADKH